MIHPLKLQHGNLTRVRDLSIDLSVGGEYDTLPIMENLWTLTIGCTGRRASSATPQTKLVDFNRHPRLSRLHVAGDGWSGIPELFSGNTPNLAVCVLTGPIIITTRSADFFDRFADGLQYLFCQGTHLIGPLQTHFGSLRHLSLHKVVTGLQTFPFRRCSVLTSLAFELEDNYNPTRFEDLNGFIQDVLRYTSSTVQFLTIRTGILFMLSAVSVHSILRTTQLRYLLLDGALALDGRDWVLLSQVLQLHVVARIPSWIPFPDQVSCQDGRCFRR